MQKCPHSLARVSTVDKGAGGDACESKILDADLSFFLLPIAKKGINLEVALIFLDSLLRLNLESS
jgi:hypothetical protein